jgi:membrane associated rhomboid family serine protease
MQGNSIWDDIKWQFKYGADLVKLILVNLSVFIIINLVSLPFALFQREVPFNLKEWLSLHAGFNSLLHHPWGIITYMFVHDNFWHILWNMLGLYWFGQILQDMVGKAKILPLYLFGGIVGGLLYIAAYNIFPVFSTIVGGAINMGASASVMAIVLAAATIAPNYELILFLIGPVKIKWIALVYVILDLINIQNGNAGGHIAHLGGALFGFIFIRQLQSGRDFSRIFYTASDFFFNLFKRKPKLKVEYKKEYASTFSAGTRQGKQANSQSQQDTTSKQERLDAILDKINRSSYDSLSKEEKDFLFKISQED